MAADTPPKLDERFIYAPRFGLKKVRMLNVDGHIDYAHQMGLISLKTEVVRQWVEENREPVLNEDLLDQIEKINEKLPTDRKLSTEMWLRLSMDEKVTKTRWCLAKATAVVRNKDGGTTEAEGMSCATFPGDNFVKNPGLEVAVAETRAIKRALANACDITEKIINPSGKAPTRETVDLPLEPGDEDDDEGKVPNLPSEVVKRPNITPAISSIKARETTDQFEV